ncbi:hypothetical protein FJY70_00205 [candidate division WOR-3 bacterium]|nr:hypothetical protein [candidate division WOR-3 bacterium]
MEGNDLFSIYDASGRLVRSLRAGHNKSGQGYTAVWDGTSTDGRTLPQGVYTCILNTGSMVSSVRVVRQ